MPNIISSDLSSGIVTYFLPAGEDLIVQPDVLIYSTGEFAIYGQGDNIVLLRDGATILSYSDLTTIVQTAALQLGFNSTDGKNDLTIQDGVLVQGAYDGVKIAGNNNDLKNDGSILAEKTAVSIEGNLNYLLNNGDINSDNGIAVKAGTNADLQNFGNITSSAFAFGGEAYGVWIDGVNASVMNAGDITGQTAMFFDGIADFDGDTRLDNAGQIVGYYYGVATADEGLTINNSGLISATDDNFATIAHNASDPDEEQFLNNTGTILSAGTAYSGSVGEDRITNTGTISGDINLRDGDDKYLGRTGTVDGIVDGGAGNDDLVGGAEANELRGGDGDDKIFGLGNIDILEGGAGNDEIYGGGGTDFGGGGEGNDLIRGGDGDDWFLGGSGDDLMLGGAGNDEMDGEGGNDTLRMGSGDDIAEGRGGQDIIHGGTGDDRLGGGTSSDTLFGGAGADTIDGGAGTDRINGGTGDDLLTGGKQADTFVFHRDAGFDVITDFVDGADTIDLHDFGLRILDYSGIVAPALSDAGGGATLLDLGQLGGTGTIRIEGLAFADADAADFLL